MEVLFQEGGLHTRLRLGEDPDDDMMYMARAKCFVLGRRGFSALAAELVRAHGERSYERLHSFNEPDHSNRLQ